jgi:flavin reductase (DIM6/NTAB) family NADH-FMN oxidoreductase RutF
MQFDFDRMTPERRFEFMTSTIVPRPIAIVTTCGADGSINGAPYSFFGLLSHDPPVIAIGVLPHPEGRMKDTGVNVLATHEFVVNLVSEEMAEAMNLTCIDAPPGIDELRLADLPTAPSDKVRPPRIAVSPVALECRVQSTIALGPNQLVALGQIVQAHVRDEHVLDRDSGLIDTPALKLIGGMHGAKWYTRTWDRFEMERPTWAEWSKRRSPP